MSLLLWALLAGCAGSAATVAPPAGVPATITASADLQSLPTATPDPLAQLETQGAPTKRPPTQPGPTLMPTPTATAEPVEVLQPLAYLPAGEALNLQSIDMFDAKRGWGIAGLPGEDQHVLRTEDGGQTWFDVSPPQLTYDSPEAALTAFGRIDDASTAWVGYGYSFEPSFSLCDAGAVGALWHTEDGGFTWSRGAFVGWGQDIGGIGCGFPTIDFVDASRGWAWRDFFLGAGSTNYQLFRTDDGGLTWQLMPDGYLYRVSGLDFIDRSHGWATISYPLGYSPALSLARTADGGETWEVGDVPLPDDPGNLADCRVHSPAMRSATAGELTVSCTTRDLEPAWFRYQTTDDGRSWRIQSIPDQPDQYVSSLTGWKLQTAPDEMQGGEQGLTCILRWTQDGGRSWSETAAMGCDTQLDFVTSQMGWALKTVEPGVTQLQRTADGGHTWEPVHPTTEVTKAPDERMTPARILPLGDPQLITAQTAGELRLLQQVPASGVTSIGFYPPYDQMFTAHQDGTVTIWDLAEGRYGRLVRLHSDWIYDLVVAERSRLLATASKDGHLRFLWLYGNRRFEDLSGLGGEVSAVAAGQDGALFAAAGQEAVVRIWRFGLYGTIGDVDPPAELIHDLRGHQAWVWDLALSPDGTTLASGSADRSVRVWDVETGEQLQVLNAHNATVGALAFSPDGTRLASAAWDGSVVLWDTQSWQPLAIADATGLRVYSIAFSADGSFFASGAADGSVTLWSAQDGQLLGKLQVAQRAVQALAFLPSGSALITASDDGLLRIWGTAP